MFSIHKNRYHPVKTETYLREFETVNNPTAVEVLSQAELELSFLQKSVDGIAQLTFSERMGFDILKIEGRYISWDLG